MPVPIFISHIAEEAPLARTLKARLESDFLGAVAPFVSSDGTSIAAGENWLTSIDEALQSAKVLIVLCSPASVDSAWINFECGAAWVRQIPIVPFCHSGLSPDALPMPLKVLQALRGDTVSGIELLYARVARTVGLHVPRSGPAALAAAVRQFQDEYDPAEQQQRRATEQLLTDLVRGAVAKAPHVFGKAALAMRGDLLGAWVSDDGSHMYVREIHGKLYGPYCLSGNHQLTGAYTQWQPVSNFWFARFRWVTNDGGGFAYYRLVHRDRLAGLYWIVYDDNPRVVVEDPSVPPDSGSIAAGWTRLATFTVPPWAEEYFRNV